MPVIPPVDSLHDFFATLEEQFLHSIMDSDSATNLFATRLAKLQNISFADSSIMSLAHSASSTIKAISSNLLDLQRESEEIEQDLFTDIDNVFQCLSLEESVTDKTYSDSDCRHTTVKRSLNRRESSLVVEEPSNRYSEPLRWLLKHLDNPYPSMPIKQSLSKQSGVPLKTLSEWFSQTRRRIGWTAVLKRHFMGNRQLAVDCAHRVLVERSGAIHYPQNIVRDIVTMRTVAERLYDKKVQPNCHFMDDEIVNQNPVLDDRGSMTPSKLALRSSLTCYHTPPHDDVTSDSASHSLPLEFDTASRISRDARNILNNKRTRDALISEEQAGVDTWEDISEDYLRPSKRLRCLQTPQPRTVSRAPSHSTLSSRESTCEPSTPSSITASLPIAPSTDAVNDWISSLENVASMSLPQEMSGARKRRLSDSDIYESFKRSRVEDIPIQTRIVSEPLPSLALNPNILSYNILSSLDFSLPPPATLSSVLHCEDLPQLDVFDYSNEYNESNDDFNYDSNNPSVCAYDLSAVPRIATGSTTNIKAGESQAFSADSCLDFLLGNSNFDPKSRTNADEVKNILSTTFFCDQPGEAPSLSRSTSSSSSFPEMCDSSHLAKLDRINQLLVEAAELQREVFG